MLSFIVFKEIYKRDQRLEYLLQDTRLSDRPFVYLYGRARGNTGIWNGSTFGAPHKQTHFKKAKKPKLPQKQNNCYKTKKLKPP